MAGMKTGDYADRCRGLLAVLENSGCLENFINDRQWVQVTAESSFVASVLSVMGALQMTRPM